MSRHAVAGGDLGGLFALFSELRQKALSRARAVYPLVVIQEVGLDGFWIGRALNKVIENPTTRLCWKAIRRAVNSPRGNVCSWEVTPPAFPAGAKACQRRGPKGDGLPLECTR